MYKMLKDLLKMLQDQKKPILVSMLLSFFDGFLLTIPLIFSFLIVKDIVNDTITAKTIVTYSWIIIGAIIVRIILRYFTLKLRSGAGYISMCKQRKELGQDLKEISMGYFSKKNLGDLLTTITSDVGFIEIEGLGIVEKIAIGVPSLIVGIVLLFSFDYRIGIVISLLFIPVYIAYYYLATVQKRYNLDRQNQIAVFADEMVDFIKGVHVLKINNMSYRHFLGIKKAYARIRDLSYKIEVYHIPTAALFQFFLRIISFAIILMAAQYAVRGEMSFAVAFILMLISMSVFAGFEMMGIYSIFSKMTRVSMSRISEIRNIPKMNIYGNEKLDAFDIRFEDVNFSYDTTPVLKNMSFRVDEKTSTALVGLSGSGKTTIMNLISRFWDVQEGSVLIGGKDVKKLSYENLLKNISFVFQDVFLFDDTVLNNIRMARPDASMDEVIEVAKKARCLDFIMNLENGYDTLIGENGDKLSGGEKQRISIARALIKNAPIILLDEVTANVDLENELHIKIALQELLKEKTVVMIAHKLSTIQHVDQILVVENGEIIQSGKHQQLLQEEGRYKTLWDLQFRASNWHV